MPDEPPPAPPLTAPALPALAFVAAAAIVLIPALANGYPLLFYDSADYIAMSVTGAPVVYRTMPYALLVMPLHLGWSLWPVAVAQSLLAAWVLRETIAVFRPGASAWTLPLAAALLTVLTSLPWYAGQIMPDVFAGLLPLCLACLALDEGRLGTARRAALAAIAAVSVACHLSLIPLALGLLAVLALLRGLSGGGGPRPRLGLAAGAVAAGIALVPGLHWAATGTAYFSQSGPVFLLARLIQDGIAKKYLDAVCPSPDYRLCAFKDRLPATANDYLWRPGSILGDVGGWTGSVPEARRVVLGSLRLFPGAHLVAATKDSWMQFRTFPTGDGLVSQVEYTAERIQEYFPAEFPAFRAAWQQAGRLDFARVNELHLPVLWAALTALPLLAGVLAARGDRTGAALALLMLLALAGNAVACGVLSNPDGRYQSRLAWIAPFTAAVCAGRLRMRP